MNTIRLHQGGVEQPGLLIDQRQKIVVRQHRPILCRQVGKHRVKRRFVVRAVVSGRAQAHQQHGQSAFRCLGKDRIQIGPACRRVDAAQKVVAAQVHDHCIHVRRQRPVQPRQPARRGIARHPGVDQHHIPPLCHQPGLHLRHEPLRLIQPVSRGQTVTQCHHRDRFRKNRTGQRHHCKRSIAQPQTSAISSSRHCPKDLTDARPDPCAD